jgi:hypothetical protein
MTAGLRDLPIQHSLRIVADHPRKIFSFSVPGINSSRHNSVALGTNYVGYKRRMLQRFRNPLEWKGKVLAEVML